MCAQVYLCKNVSIFSQNSSDFVEATKSWSFRSALAKILASANPGVAAQATKGNDRQSH